MASVLLGRTPCPECGFAAAHVKKSEKCHYRFCPQCGSQYFAKSPAQLEALLNKTRLEGTPPPADKPAAPAPSTASPATIAAPTPPAAPPPPAPRRHGLGLFQ